MPGLYTAGSNNEKYSAKNIDFTEITTHCFNIITIRNNAQAFYIFYSQKLKTAIFRIHLFPRDGW